MSSKLRFSLLSLAALLLSILVGCYGIRGPQGTVVELELQKVVPIESEIPVEPSGLCLVDGDLFSISDDTDDTIFKIVHDGDIARFEPHIQFSKPEGTEDDFLDLEGIIAGPADSFFLLSERFARVLQVFPDGRSEWVMPSVQEAGTEAGLFKVNNGGLEGMAQLGEEHFILLAERQPRGWVEVEDSAVVGAALMNKTRFHQDLTLTRIPDFTGGDFFGGRLYVLFRNGELITTLIKDKNGWSEDLTGWSFRETLADDQWGYRDTLYGMAEGLAVDEDYFYVVLDNNQSPRRYDETDIRPILLILKRP